MCDIPEGGVEDTIEGDNFGVEEPEKRVPYETSRDIAAISKASETYNPGE